MVVLVLALTAIAHVARSHDYTSWYGKTAPPSKMSWVRRCLFFFSLAISPGIFHGATGKAVIGMGRDAPEKLWDAVFLKMDTFFLGWIFPQGQVALAAQDSVWFSPELPIGRLITEILQITYMTYYFYGNVLLLILLITSMRSPTSDTHWRRCRMLLYGWVAAYLLNFGINFITPAVSPRLHLHELYREPLEGIWLGKLFQSAIKSAAGGNPAKPSSFGAFPSGHVGLTWLAALSAERLGFKKYASVCRVGAVLMTMAVVYLRYHYFVDALFAMLLVKCGLVVGRLDYDLQEADRHVCDRQSRSVEDEI